MKRVVSHSQEDALQAYYRQIRKTALLTAEEEQDLSKRVMSGDSQARQTLVEANLRLVVKIAKAYLTPDTALLDLIQDGNLGLLKAASRFDYRRGVRFSTYAAWWIKQAITRSLANRRRSIRLPHRKEDALKRIQRCYNWMSQDLMRPPTVHEIAAELHISPDEVADILQISASPISLDSEINDDNGTILDVIEDYSYAPDALVLQKNLEEETRNSLDSLQDREKRVLESRFALDGRQRQTLKNISEEMGISPETVRQIEIRAIKKLRKNADYLKELMLN